MRRSDSGTKILCFGKNWLRHQRLHSSDILTVQQSHVVRTETFHPLALDYAGCVHCVFETCLSESYKNKGGVLVVNAFTFTHCALQQPSPGYFNFWHFFLQFNPTQHLPQLTYFECGQILWYYDILTLDCSRIWIQHTMGGIQFWVCLRDFC